MFPGKSNVFDFVNEFYEQDPEWNSIMQRNVCETFLRKESWDGRSDEELIKIWNHILMFILYCGHAETMPGDMTVDDCIQCVGWCSRNIGEFEPQGEYIKAFLDSLILFYKHLVKSKVVMPTESFSIAKEKLFVKDKFTAMGVDGYFTGEFERFNNQGIPNLPSKIFIDVGEQMVKFTDLMKIEFMKKNYPHDYKRARHIYDSVSGDGVDWRSSPEQMEQAFADYFFFDYKLLKTGKPVIEDLVEQIEGDISGKYSRAFIQLMKELTKVKLLLFKVKKDLGDGVYSVIDVLRNQSYVLMLPLEADADVENVLFCGHAFNDDTMIVNFLRGTIFSQEQLKKLKDILRNAKQYYAVRQGGKCTWDDFIQNNQLLVRSLPMLIVTGIPLVENFTTNIIRYKKAKLAEDDFVAPVLPKLFPKELFSVKDVELALQMWADVQAIDTEDGEEKEEDPTILAIALSRIYINLCGIYSFHNPPPDTEEMREMKKDIDRVTKEITELLQIEKYDPRYVNEEGLFMAHIAEAREKHHGW